MLQFLIEGLGTFVKVVGPVISKFASELVTKLPRAIELAVEVLDVTSSVLKTVAEILAILKPDDDLEELGKKSLQDGTRPKMEDESMEDYFEYLRKEVQLDAERWKNMTAEEELNVKIAGTSMVTAAIAEKEKVTISPDFVLALKDIDMSANQLLEYIKSFKDNDIDSLDSLMDYLRGELSGDENKELHDIVKDTERRLHPDFTNGEILKEIDDMKEKIGK